MTNLPPSGVGAGGTSRRSFGASFTTRGGTTFSVGVGAGGTGLGADASQFTDLRKGIQGVTSDITALKGVITQLNTALKTTTQHFAALTGTSPSSGAGSTNTTGQVTAPATPSQMGGQRALALGALGEIGASWAGQINNTVTAATTGGTGIQLLAAQQAGIFGGLTTTAAGVSAYGGISNLGASDLTQAAGQVAANPFLFTQRPGSQSAKNLTAFMNAAQKINPLMGASGASSFASTLTSAPVLSFEYRRLGGQTGLLNSNGTIATPQKGLNTLISALTGTNSPAAMKQFSQTGGNMALILQNAMNNGINLTPQEMTLISQYMSTGGNLSAAEKISSGTLAGTGLQRTTAATATQLQGMTSTSGIQNTVNTLDAAMSRITKGFIANTGALAGAALAATRFATAATGAAARLAEVAGVGLAGEELAGKKGFFASLLGKAKSLLGVGKNVLEDVAPVAADVADVAGDPMTSTAGLQPNLASRANAMMHANPNLKISSGRRNSQQQSLLYALKGGQGVARPGHSRHETGHAVDIGPQSQLGWIQRNAARFGLYNPAPGSEPWHLETMGDNPEPPNWEPTPGPTSLPANWPSQVLKGLGANPNYGAGQKLLEAFAQSEHGGYLKWGSGVGALNNPLDVVAPAGSSNFNYNDNDPVQNYNKPSMGISATVSFLQGSNYTQLVSALRSGKYTLPQLEGVPRAGQWGGAGSPTSPGSGAVGTGGGGGAAGGASGFPSSSTPPPTSSSGNPSLVSFFKQLERGMTVTTAANSFLQQAGTSGNWLSSVSTPGAGSPQLISALRSLIGRSGDPVNAPMAPVSYGGGSGPVVGHLHVHAPMTMPSGTSQDDAQKFVKMVIAEMRNNDELSSLMKGNF